MHMLKLLLFVWGCCLETDRCVRASLSSANFWHRVTSGWAIVNDRSNSAMKEHKRIFKSATRSVIEGRISAVAVAPGKREVCWIARTAAWWLGSNSCRGSTFFPLVPYNIFLAHKVQKHAPGCRSFWHQLPKGFSSLPTSSIQDQRHLFFMPLSTSLVSSPGFIKLRSMTSARFRAASVENAQKTDRTWSDYWFNLIGQNPRPAPTLLPIGWSKVTYVV